MLRGICILLMVIDHFFYSFGYMSTTLFGSISSSEPIYNLIQFSRWWWNWDVRINTRYVVVAIFFLVSGICTAFSKNNFRRGLQTFTVALLVNIVMTGLESISSSLTGLNVPWGTINVFSVCILVYAFYEWICNKVNLSEPYRRRIAFVIGIIGTIIGYAAFDFQSRDVIHAEDLTVLNYIKVVLGALRIADTGDYMPLLPYLGIFFIGAGLASILYKNKTSIFQPLSKYLPTKPEKNRCKNFATYSLCWVGYGIYSFFNGIGFVIRKSGQYSLIIYIVHQILILGILVIVMYCLGYNLVL